jgi:hypothetical protein
MKLCKWTAEGKILIKPEVKFKGKQSHAKVRLEVDGGEIVAFAHEESIIKELGRQLKRPTLLRVPAFAMRLLIGKAADELLLCSQKMKSHRLEQTGFVFKHPTLVESVGYVLS